MSIDKKHYTSISIIIIGLLLIKYELRIDGEFGFIEPILCFIGWTIIVLIIVLGICKWNYGKKTIQYNSMPVWTTVIIGILAIVANRITDYRLNSEDKLIAVTNERNNRMQPDTLKLKSNGNYFAIMNEIEWGYRQSGEYKISRDTLYLDKILNSDRGEIVFRNLYVFNADKKYLIPVINQIVCIDSSEWLTIETKNAL